MNKFLAGAICGLALSAAGAQAATLDGLTLSAEYQHPELGTVYPSATTTPGTFTVGAGTEAVIEVENVTKIYLDFAANLLTVTFETTLDNPNWMSTAFNGLVFTLESGGAGSFTSFDLLSSTMSGTVTPTSDAGHLMINWSGAGYTTGTQLTFDVGFAAAPSPVPLPASLPLLGAGVAGLAALRRKTRAA